MMSTTDHRASMLDARTEVLPLVLGGTPASRAAALRTAPWVVVDREPAASRAAGDAPAWSRADGREPARRVVDRRRPLVPAPVRWGDGPV